MTPRSALLCASLCVLCGVAGYCAGQVRRPPAPVAGPSRLVIVACDAAQARDYDLSVEHEPRGGHRSVHTYRDPARCAEAHRLVEDLLFRLGAE